MAIRGIWIQHAEFNRLHLKHEHTERTSRIRLDGALQRTSRLCLEIVPSSERAHKSIIKMHPAFYVNNLVDSPYGCRIFCRRAA